jgi:hypothetical protein
LGLLWKRQPAKRRGRHDGRWKHRRGLHLAEELADADFDERVRRTLARLLGLDPPAPQ